MPAVFSFFFCRGARGVFRGVIYIYIYCFYIASFSHLKLPDSLLHRWWMQVVLLEGQLRMSGEGGE